MTEFFHSQEQESISDHALFTAAFETQRKFSEQQYATHTDALRETLPDIEQLQDMVTEAGLLNKQASLIGFDIIVPRLAREESTGIESLDPVRLDITGEPLSEHPPVEGKFYGFSQVVRKTEEGFEVDLHYRVALKEDFMQGAFVGSLCAQGSVSSSHLEFEDDTRRKNIATALDTLASKTVDDTAKVAVAYLYDLLSPKDDESAYSQYRLQQIGQTIRDLETAQGKVDLQFRDAIIDLVTARLGVEEGSYFNIEAPDGFFWSGNPESPYAITNDIHGSFTSQGIGFIHTTIRRPIKSMSTRTYIHLRLQLVSEQMAVTPIAIYLLKKCIGSNQRSTRSENSQYKLRNLNLHFTKNFKLY